MRRFCLVAVLALIASTMVLLPSSAALPLDPVCETVSGGVVVGACDITGTVSSVNEKTFEPTMAAGPDGALYYSTTPGSGVAVGFGASISKSTDGGATWTDVGAKINGQRVPLETNDPYIYVDPDTGRVFEFHMQPILACAMLSWSDDGGKTWANNPAGCAPTGPWDHQTMVAAKPRTLPTNGYPNVLHQCVNAIYAEMCSRSIDGGMTWQPAVVAWPNDKAGTLCGTQTGHLAAAPDGTVYLPTSDCGTYPTVAVSRDDGLTWTKVRVASTAMPFDDPAVAVDKSGNVYVAFYDKVGQLWFSTSRDAGKTYSAPVKMASERITAGKLAMTVGDDGKIALAHVSSGSIPGQEPGKAALSTADKAQVRWGAFMTISTDALSANPSFTTLEVSGTDPLFKSAAACGPAFRCTYIVDFIEATITPDGRPYGAFVDGCTNTSCKSGTGANNVSGNGTGVVASLNVDLCEARCPRMGAAPSGEPAPTAPVPPGTDPSTPTPKAGESPVAGMSAATFAQLRREAHLQRVKLATGGAGQLR